MSETGLAVIAVAAMLIACAAAIVAAVAASRTAALRTSYRAFAPDGGDVFDALERQREELEVMRGELRTQAEANARALAIVGRTLSRVATVRYDAFGDMGGHLSFSTALLDEEGNGVVLTCINSRDHARTYAKQVLGGEGQHLSAEEDQAVRRALAGGGVVPTMADHPAPGPALVATSARRARRPYPSRRSGQERHR